MLLINYYLCLHHHFNYCSQEHVTSALENLHVALILRGYMVLIMKTRV